MASPAEWYTKYVEEKGRAPMNTEQFMQFVRHRAGNITDKQASDIIANPPKVAPIPQVSERPSAPPPIVVRRETAVRDESTDPLRRHYYAIAAKVLAGHLQELERRMSNVGLHTAFDVSEIRPWQPSRFKAVQKVQDQSRSHAQVHIMWDTTENKLVAVKQLPSNWLGSSHDDFVSMHPQDIELPWQDIGCASFLNSVGYPYRCNLEGVYRDDTNILVVTACATEGDLFHWCGNHMNKSLQPGTSREAFVRPLVIHLLLAVQQLHELSIIHRDISMENVLLSKKDNGRMLLKIIDFAMASTSRYFCRCLRGKPQYQAPEVYEGDQCDGFLTDAFAVGVTVYGICFKGLPWLSTKPGECQSFAYVRKRGFRAYVRKRNLQDVNGTLADHVSEELFRMLEGLLELDPRKRLTLGEKCWPAGRRSVWDEGWLRERRRSTPSLRTSSISVPSKATGSFDQPGDWVI